MVQVIVGIDLFELRRVFLFFFAGFARGICHRVAGRLLRRILLLLREGRNRG